MTDFELGWLVGLMEGEGTFCLQKQRYPIMAIAMLDRDIIARVAKIWGSNVTFSFTQQTSKQIFKTGVTGHRSRYWMTLLKPHLSFRRQQQITLCLSVYEKEVA